MKLRITQKQLNELNSEQQQNLSDLWIPNLYDAAVATVCVDAAEEKYGQITYVIGGITLQKNNNMVLYDLKFLPEEKIRFLNEEDDNSGSDSELVENEVENESEQDIEENDSNEEVAPEDEDFFGEDFNFEFQRPESYTKHECLPLLNIGQMIDILAKKNYGKCNFSLSVETDEEYIEMGKDNFISESNFKTNDENVELCDILWNAVKTVL